MKKENESGFTLLEIIIAMTVLSFLMAFLYTIVDDSTRTKNDVISEDQDFLQVQTALHRMNLDFSQIYSPLYHSVDHEFYEEYDSEEDVPIDELEQRQKTKYKGTPNFPLASIKGVPAPIILQEDKTHIQFFTTANRRRLANSKQSQFTWVDYSLESMGEKENKDETDLRQGLSQLVRRVINENVFADEFDWTKIKPQIILKNIKSIEYHFWHHKRKKFVDTLNSLEEFEQYTPRAVKIKILWVNKTNQDQETIRVFRPLFPYFDPVKDELRRNPPSGRPIESEEGEIIVSEEEGDFEDGEE